MGVRRALLVVLALIVANPFGARPAFAQVADDAKKTEAIKHFEIGVDLAKQEAWDSALAEFLRSRELYPTKNALKNAAMCLRELKRFDEALDMYDELVARFGGELTPAEKAAVEDDQKKLGKFVGTLTIVTDTPGARVVVDGRERGVTPLAKPLRVTVGTRAIAITKQGFAPFETKVMVSSGEAKSVNAKLTSVSNAGKLRVTEAKGRAFDVVLDGAVVGKTPWEGTVAAGTHTVALRGPSDEGTATKPVEVVTDKPTELSLEATKIPGELRVSPTPAETSIFVDGKLVGAGAFKGEVASGDHVVTLSAPWHRDHSATLTFFPGRTEVMTVSLERIRRIYLELQPIINPLAHPKGTFASNEGAKGGLFGTMLRVGLKLHPHLAIELGGGYAYWKHMRSGNSLDAKTCIDCPPGAATGPSVRGNLIDESISYQGPIVTLAGSAHFGDTFPILLRLTTGLWFTQQEGRGGIFSGVDQPHQFPDTTNSGICPLVGPEARAGVRLSRATTIDLGVVVSAVFCGAHDFGPRTLPTGQGLRPLRTEDVQLLWSPTLGLRVEL